MSVLRKLLRSSYWRYLFLLIIPVFIIQLSPQVFGLSAEQQALFSSGIYYFDAVASSCGATGSESIPAGILPTFIPEPYNGAFTKGANNHGVAPTLVAALFSEEHNLANSPDNKNPDTSKVPAGWAGFIKRQAEPNSGWAESSDGAQGPFQFMQATFTGLGYNVSNINNLVVSADAAARYAETDKATKDASLEVLKKFIFSYNHADWYVNAVLDYYDYYNGQPAAISSGESTVVSTGTACSSNGIVAGNIAKTAIGLSWPEPFKTKLASEDRSNATTPTSAYAAALKQYNPSGGLGDDCGVFVSTVMRASGADPNYPTIYTVTQAEYVIKHPEKYIVIYPVINTSQLKAGDILILNSGTSQNPDGSINVGNGAGAAGHTMIYVGGSYDEASASLGERSANLDKIQLADSRGSFLIARLR